MTGGSIPGLLLHLSDPELNVTLDIYHIGSVILLLSSQLSLRVEMLMHVLFPQIFKKFLHLDVDLQVMAENIPYKLALVLSLKAKSNLNLFTLLPSS